MQGLKVAFRLITAVMVISGCAQFASVPADQDPAFHALSPGTPNESCEVLGKLTARADCACYDKMSYDRVRGRASENVQEQARTQYPESDVVEVSNVDLFLNHAVAHGVAYRCLAKSDT